MRQSVPRLALLTALALAPALALGTVACSGARSAPPGAPAGRPGGTGGGPPGPVPGHIARAHRVALGAAVRWDRVGDLPGYASLFLAHYRWLTPENELKMESLEPANGVFDFARADALVDWAGSQGKAVHGHVLVWGNQLPRWLRALARTGPSRVVVVRSAMETYIRGVLAHFHGRIDEWDVVNEAFDAHGNWAHNLWWRHLGPGYVRTAFEIARTADPTLRLCYNDGGTEVPGRHASAVLGLVRRLRRAHLLDCLGSEMHVAGVGPAADLVLRQLRRFAATGAVLLVSELDVSLAGVRNGERRRRAIQAATYAKLAGACARVPACLRVTTWGFTDASSWLGSAAEALPFDARRRAKPAWFALTTALAR